MRSALATLLAFPLAVAACTRAPSEPSAPASEPETEDEFSAERAFGHLEALAEIGPRVAGTPGAAQARAYIRGHLEALGLEVRSHRTTADLVDGTTLELESLIAVLPGDSADLFVLAAPYDTRHFTSFEFVGANGGASGPAVLLELARVLSTQRLVYTTWIVFLDGEAPLGRGNAEEATTAWIGSSELARAWSRDGRLDRIRLLVYLHQVADADLRIARDLRSHRSYRETFWDVARRRGYADVFGLRQHYESPAAGHLPFISRGLRRAVLVMDTSFGGDEPPGLYTDTEDDTLARCSAESLGAVGEVTLASVHEIAQRLAKIDRFADAPLAAPSGPPIPGPAVRAQEPGATARDAGPPGAPGAVGRDDAGTP